MNHRTLLAACIALSTVCPPIARADVTDLEALQAQIAGTMASADYARKKCPNLTIDEEHLASQIKRSKMSVEALKATEDYTEQRDVIAEMEKSPRGALICTVLPMAHGGYGRDIILEK
jgi:hypothetical protein